MKQKGGTLRTKIWTWIRNGALAFNCITIVAYFLAHPEQVNLELFFLTIASILLTIIFFAKKEGSKTQEENLPEEYKEGLAFRTNRNTREEVERLSGELEIPNEKVLLNAFQLYAVVVDQFANAKGKERQIEVTDGATLQEVIDISQVLPLHKSHLKIIK